MDAELRNRLLDKLGGRTPSTSAVPSAPSKNNGKLARGATSSVEDRAVNLLGAGVTPEQTALALGVSAARISQLMAREEFAAEVAAARYQNLQQHNDRDQNYNDIEDTLIEKLGESVHMMTNPDKILRAVQVVNNAKRRGNSTPDQVIASQNIVSIALPANIAESFTVSVDINNQVKRAGEQELQTIQSSTLLNQVTEARELRAEALEYNPTPTPEEEV